MRTEGFWPIRILGVLLFACALAVSCSGGIDHCQTPANARCDYEKEGVCNGAAGCNWGMGCGLRCSTLTEEGACSSDSHCIWSGSLCAARSGLPGSICAETTEGACTSAGCAWRLGCSGTLAPCEGRTASNCNVMPYSYCEWVKEPSGWQLGAAPGN